jgi:hypothetical protein
MTMGAFIRFDKEQMNGRPTANNRFAVDTSQVG